MQLRTRDPRTKVKLYDERTVGQASTGVIAARVDHAHAAATAGIEWSPNSCAGGGRYVEVIEQVYPPQGFRSFGMSLKSYGAARLDRACRRALSSMLLGPPHA